MTKAGLEGSQPLSNNQSNPNLSRKLDASSRPYRRDALATSLLRVSKVAKARSNQVEDTTVDWSGDERDGAPGSPVADSLGLVKYSLAQFSDQLDPFAQLPVALNRFQEHVVNFYLLYYPKVTYGLSARLRPRPVATNFSIAINNPPNFQIALARSALYRIMLKQYATHIEKQDLEIAVIKHKTEAIKMVKKMSTQVNASKEQDNLVAAIISLGTLDNRSGSDETAKMHLKAVRRLLRDMGGPLNLKSILLSRVMAHFECIYGTHGGSYVWDQSDRGDLLRDLNRLLGRLWTVWGPATKTDGLSKTTTPATEISSPRGPSLRGSGQKSSTIDSSISNMTRSRKDSLDSTPSRNLSICSSGAPFVDAFAFKPESGLHEALSRPIKDQDGTLTEQERMKLSFQLTCLLTLCHVVLDHAHRPEMLTLYMTNVNHMIDEAQLVGQPCNNHMWLIQVHDQSSRHSKRIWRAAGFVWLLRSLPYTVQTSLRDWLFAFMCGEDIAGKYPKTIDTFHFSYAV